MIIRGRQIDTRALESILPDGITNAALTRMLIEMTSTPDDMRDFEEFLARLLEADGDLNSVLLRTHQPVGIRQFIEDDYFLGFGPNDETLWKEIKRTAIEIVEGGYVEALLLGAIGIGKALDVVTPILTQNRGWQTMGTLLTGDVVYDENGKPTRVLKAHDTLYERDCYEVTFSDGTTIVADGGHLWQTQTRADRRPSLVAPRPGTVKTTTEIRDSLRAGRYLNHSVPLAGAFEGSPQNLAIRPYVLGAWLGDGHTASARLTCDDRDVEVVQHIRKEGTSLVKRGAGEGKTGLYQFTTTHHAQPFYAALDSYGLRKGKHIPDAYLVAPVADRLALLQGLMDTDGTCSKQTGVCEYTTVLPRLADDIMRLLWGLGLKPTRSVKDIAGSEYQRITFTAHRDALPVFRLARKLELQPVAGKQAIRQRSRYITAVTPVETRPVRCITVDSPNSLYLVGHQMVPTHNTTLAQICTWYYLYQMSCELVPALSMGLMQTSSIVVAMLNKTDTLAKDVTFGEFRNMGERIPYFQEQFPYGDATTKMLFPKNIRVEPYPAASDQLLGMNVIGGIADEMNFMDVVEKSKRAENNGTYDQAEKIYGTVVRRRKSRFLKQGRLPGCLFVVSSKGRPGDFTERRAAEVQAENDGTTFIWDKPVWMVKPRKYYSGRTFVVEVGNERVNSRILGPEDTPREGLRLLRVPVELHKDFTKDMEGSLRDHAGVSTLANNPFFSNREAIWNAADLFERATHQPVFSVDEWCLDDDLPPVNPHWRLKNPDRRRLCHIDLGLTSDHCGISVGYVSEVRAMQIRDRATNQTFVEDMPIVVYDTVIRIRPPLDGEIEFSMVREVIYYLRDTLGIPIRWVTLDGFQSADTKQIMRRHGFMTSYESVDGKESKGSYAALRSAFHENRLLMQRHDFGFGELAALEEDKKKEIIDHTPTGSKDVADSICGVYKGLVKKRGSWKVSVEDMETMQRELDTYEREVARRERMTPEERERVEALEGPLDPVAAAPSRVRQAARRMRIKIRESERR